MLINDIQGMFNSYASIQAYWSDTILMDNLRGADSTGVATPGAQEISIDATTGAISGNGNTVHTYSQDSYASYHTYGGADNFACRNNNANGWLGSSTSQPLSACN